MSPSPSAGADTLESLCNAIRRAIVLIHERKVDNVNEQDIIVCCNATGAFERAAVQISSCRSFLHVNAYPASPLSPATHFELHWRAGIDGVLAFSGQAELLPNYLDEDDAFQFHAALKNICQAHRNCTQDKDQYWTWKENADIATRDPHTLKYRGVGGIKFENVKSIEFAQAFVDVFLHDYMDIVQHKMTSTFIEIDKQWMLYRRYHILRSLVQTQPRLSEMHLPPSSAISVFPHSYPPAARSMLVAMKTPRPSYIECLFMQAIRGVSVPRPPVWLHRQAGRYLPEYKAVKGDRGFLDITGDPVLAAEITLQPVKRYNVDCAIIFSDIMTIPQALGMELLMTPGPFFPHPIRTKEDIDALKYRPDVLTHVYDALRLTKRDLAVHKALVGFCGAPWTLMAYMIGKDLAKKWLHMHPDLAMILLQKCTDVAIDYLVKQVEAGADVVQVFDSNAADLGPEDFYTFSFPFLQQIAAGVKEKYPHVPMTVFPRGATFCIKRIADETLYDCVSVDWATSPEYARELAGPYLTLQGNLEPDVMYEPVEQIRQKVRRMIKRFGKCRYIVNLGHGTKPDMSVEAVGAFIEEAQKVFIGSRNSPLALAQANIVLDGLVSVAPQHRYEVVGVMTKGDKILDVPLAQIGDKGLFTKELEYSLMRGDVDLVQHSLKDLETTLPVTLTLGSVLRRADHRDSLISSAAHKYTLKTLPHGARVGTSSLRRMSQIRSLRPDVEVCNIRGNLNTRLTKLLKGNDYDALLLAMAGIQRLDTSAFDLHVQPLNETEFIPAVSQGAIGIEVRTNDRGILHLVRTIEDRQTRQMCDQERDFLRAIQGGCQVPVAVRTWRDGFAGIKIEAHVWDQRGSIHLCTEASSGYEAAHQLDKLGAADIINNIRL